jgi:hypothetical protein
VNLRILSSDMKTSSRMYSSLFSTTSRDFPMLNVLVVADFLRLYLPFYEDLVDQLEIMEYIKLIKRLWENRNSITSHEQIQISLSNGIAHLSSIVLVYDLSFTEYAEILLSLSDVAIGRRISARLDLPESILREWKRVCNDSEWVDDNDDPLFGSTLMSADYIGHTNLTEIVSQMNSEQFTDGFMELKAEIGGSADESIFERLLFAAFGEGSLAEIDLNKFYEVFLTAKEFSYLLSIYAREISLWLILVTWHDKNSEFFIPEESESRLFEVLSLLNGIGFGHIPLTNLECNLIVKPFIENLVNVTIAEKMKILMFRSVIASSHQYVRTYPPPSVIIRSTHWNGLVEQISSIFGDSIDWGLAYQTSGMEIDGIGFFPLTEELYLIILQTKNGEIVAVGARNDLISGNVGVLSFLVSFDEPRSEFDQGVNLKSFPLPSLQFDSRLCYMNTTTIEKVEIFKVV